MNLCDIDYDRIESASSSRRASPMESLFGGSQLFDEFFNDGFRDLLRQPSMKHPSSREAIDIESYLSEHANELLQKAAHTAHSFGKSEVDTEHLLLALTESDVVQAIFKDFDLSISDLKEEVEKQSPRETVKAGGTEEDKEIHIGVSPRVKSALESAFHASRAMGHSYVGPEHLLIGLVEEEEGIASDVLGKYGVTANALRQKALKVVGKGAETGQVKTETSTPNLDKYSRDLTDLAKAGKLDPVIGRAKEIETTIEVLARRKKNNPCLIGDPGVGKTAIVEGLAQRIVRNEVPEVLRGKRLVELNVNSLIAGSKYRGELEERVKQVLDEVVARQKELIVFIDEIHTIVGAGGGGEGGMDIAQVFKPALARGELNLIGATTLNEYQKYIEKDAALERRFQPVLVPEPSVADTVEILRGLRDRLEAHHKVRISEKAIEAAAKLSDRYIQGRRLPDKAIDLIDQASARVRIMISSRPPEIYEIEERLRRLKQERDSAKTSKQTDKSKALGEYIHAEEKRLASAREAWKKSVGTKSEEVTPQHVAGIVSSLTGIPVADLTAEDKEKLLNLEERLKAQVVGQDEAVSAVSDVVRLARTAMREPNHPIATFLFLGPTGVGKTELCKALARTMFGDENALVRIDMSEYMERHSVARLIGAPPGYVGYDEGGQLTEKVRRRPYCVVLLDEIEKAHGDVANILLQLFDEGRLTDGKGRVVDFTNTIIIATSNLGSDLIQRNTLASSRDKLSYDELKSRMMETLRRHFRPEFINRIDEVIVFNGLGKDQIKQIVRIQLERVRHTAGGQGIRLEFDDTIVDHLSEVGFRPEFGARELKRKIRTDLETKIATSLLKEEFGEGDRVTVKYSDGQGVTFEKHAREEAKPGRARAAHKAARKTEEAAVVH
jgi:ATP-dependent Clp protease ATP-binding subunit ClpC